MDCIQQVLGAISIFWDCYNQLTSLKAELGYYLDQSAEYYHTKANCQAAQLGDAGAQTAEFLGQAREFFDKPKEVLFKGKSIQEAFENSAHDLEINEKGRELGKENPDTPWWEIIIERPPGLPEEYW